MNFSNITTGVSYILSFFGRVSPGTDLTVSVDDQLVKHGVVDDNSGLLFSYQLDLAHHGALDIKISVNQGRLDGIDDVIRIIPGKINDDYGIIALKTPHWDRDSENNLLTCRMISDSKIVSQIQSRFIVLHEGQNLQFSILTRNLWDQWSINTTNPKQQLVQTVNDQVRIGDLFTLFNTIDEPGSDVELDIIYRYDPIIIGREHWDDWGGWADWGFPSWDSVVRLIQGQSVPVIGPDGSDPTVYHSTSSIPTKEIPGMMVVFYPSTPAHDYLIGQSSGNREDFFLS
jgi:hypothetical protein